MGRKGNWFTAVKRALIPPKKDQPNKGGYDKHNVLETALPNEEASFTVPRINDIKLTEEENEQNRHAYSVALATAVAAEAAVAAARAAAEVVRLTSGSRHRGKSKEEQAAIKIQTAFRGYLARRALRALRGLVRLKNLIQGQSVKQQAASTLRCMQTLSRLQSQVCERRAKMSEENQAFHRQLLQKHGKEIEKLQAAQSIGEWDDRAQSKEQIEARRSKRQEAAVRREKAMTYAFTHQQKWRNSAKPVNPTTTFLDPNNPHWGWSWLDRWMEARSWESESAMPMDHNDRATIKSTASQSMSVGEITKLYSLRDHISRANKPSPAGQRSSRPPSHQSPSTSASKPPSSSTSGKVKTLSPSGSNLSRDDDSRSTFSVKSERYRRHTISGSSVRDDESLASAPALPKRTLVKGKFRTESLSSSSAEKKVTPEKGPVNSAKKRLSFPDSPAAPRKHVSGPVKVDFALR